MHLLSPRNQPSAQTTRAALDELPDDELLHQLFELHRTRNHLLLRGPDDAFARDTARIRELECEYLRRLVDRVPIG